jgi:amidase
VLDIEVDYGLVMGNTSVRYLAGAHHDVATMARPERLERTTRRLAAVGGRLPNALVARARTNQRAIAERMNRAFERADVVLTPMTGGPPPNIADVAGHGLLRSWARSNVVAWAAPWNAIGQPAASVPAGFDADGLPLAVQLCGRRGDEATLLRVAAQLEAVRPWADTVPPLGPGN